MRAHDLQTLLALEEIKRLKAAYCRYLDTKQWQRLRGLFAEGTVFEGFGSAPTGSTVDQFIAGISGRLTDAVTVHHCHMPEIEFLAAGRARGVWAMMDLVELGGGRCPKEAPGHRGFHGLGHYEEEYGLIDGAWKFTFLRLTRLRVDPLPHDHPLPRTDLLAHSPEWLPG